MSNSENANPEEMERIKNELVIAMERVTAKDIEDLTPTDAIQHDIVLTDYKPIRQRVRKSPVNKRAELKQLLDKMIQHDSSDTASPSGCRLSTL